MLKMGGAEIIRSTLGKNITSNSVRHIYEWVDPNRPPFSDFGDFLLARSKV